MPIVRAGALPHFRTINNGRPMDRAIINKKLKIASMSSALANSILYSFLGIGILIVAFVLVEVLTPRHNMRHEILEKQNMAVAVLAGFFMLAIAIIIASAIH
jgi:uncharacterized membrane protein YjfL (UPF0719 family)